jgi:hypothetical protein
VHHNSSALRAERAIRVRLMRRQLHCRLAGLSLTHSKTLLRGPQHPSLSKRGTSSAAGRTPVSSSSQAPSNFAPSGPSGCSVGGLSRFQRSRTATSPRRRMRNPTILPACGIATASSMSRKAVASCLSGTSAPRARAPAASSSDECPWHLPAAHTPTPSTNHWPLRGAPQSPKVYRWVNS